LGCNFCDGNIIPFTVINCFLYLSEIYCRGNRYYWFKDVIFLNKLTLWLRREVKMKKEKLNHAKHLAWLVLVLLPALLLPVGCVEPDSGIAVQSITLNENLLTFELGVDQPVQLIATIAPLNATDKNIIWGFETGSRDDVVTIVNGLVTPIAVGETIIKATVGGISVTVEVKVVPRRIFVESVSFQPQTIQMKEGFKTILTATVLPHDATDKRIKWYVADTSMINIVDSLYASETYDVISDMYTTTFAVTVTALKQGSTTIRVVTNTNNGNEEKAAECIVNVGSPDPIPFKLVMRTLNHGGLDGANNPLTTVVPALSEDDVAVNWTAPTWTGSLTVTNREAGAHPGNNAPPRNATIAYVHPPIQGSFTWEIKATILEGNAGTPSPGGLMVTRFINAPDYITVGNGGEGSLLPLHCGVAHFNVAGSPGSNGNPRRVFPQPGETVSDARPGGGDAPSPIAINVEYRYRVSWDAENQTTEVGIFNAAGTERLFHQIVTNSSPNINELIQDNTVPYYPAFWVSNNSVRITEMRLLMQSEVKEVESIEITGKPEDDKLGINSAFKLSADFTPADTTLKNVTWVSSDPTIAKVGRYSGVVTGVNEGTVTITATADNSDTDTYNISIYKVDVDSVTINNNSTSDTDRQNLSRAGTRTLTALVEPANASFKAITWTSSDPDVAEVDASTGVVTGISLGTAEITATADGVASSALFYLNIIEPVTESVTLSQTAVSIHTDEKVTLTVTVLPTTLLDMSVIWSAEPADIVTVIDGVVTPLKAGTATVTATAVTKGEGDVDVKATCVVTVNAGIKQGHKLIVRSMLNTPDNSTPETDEGFTFLTIEPVDGKDNEWVWTGSQNIYNTGTGRYSDDGIFRSTLLYLSEPIEGNFTWSGKMSQFGTTGGNRGVVLGVFIDPPAILPERATSTTPVYFAGAAMYYNAWVGRWLYTDNSTGTHNTRGGNLSAPTGLAAGTTYDFQIKWDGEKYSVELNGVKWDIDTDAADVNVNIFKDGDRHPGIIFQGAALSTYANISELRLVIENE
jgi:uncharacterized protein YjdB